MSAIAGIFGEGSVEEVRSMLARMPYRGPRQRVWSPTRNVYFGAVGHDLGTDAVDAVALTAPIARVLGLNQSRQSWDDGLSRDPVKCLRALHGDFSLAALSGDSGGSVLLAVDQMAWRCLYVVRVPGRWIFASDYKAVLALGDCPAAVDRDALQFLLRYGRCGFNDSLLAGARRLARGQWMRLGPDGECAAGSYVDSAAMQSVGSRPVPARRIRDKLESIILRQLDGQSRLAITLSAGFDSTALLALVRHVRPDIRIISYTIGNGADDPEILGARRSAEYFKTEHHETLFNNLELERVLPRYLWLTENLAGRGQAIMQHKIGIVVAENEKLLMAGHAADMIFGGMPRHRLMWIADRSPPPVRGALREFFVYTQIRTVPKSWLGRELLKFAQGERPSEGLRVLGARAPKWSEHQMTLNGYRTENWTTDSIRYDETALDEGGVTLLAPFADPELRDLALGLPGSSLVSARQQKRILRESMKELLPDFLLRRPKAIQVLRQDDDLSNTLRRIGKSLDLDKSLADRGLFPPGAANAVLLSSAGKYTKTALNDLWGLVCAELWVRTFCDVRGAAPVDSILI